MTMLGWIISLLLVLLMLMVTIFDLVSHHLKLPPVGERLHAWALRYPVYAGIAATLLGALLGHFFWQ